MWLRRYSLPLLAGLVALAGLVVVIGSAYAQTPTPEPAKSSFNFADTFLTHLASNLGIDKDRLVEQMKAAAKATVDDAVQQGKLTTDQAQRLKQRIDQFSPGQFRGGLFFRPGRGHFPAWPDPAKSMGSLLQAAAQKLNMSVDQLRNELRSGKSLAQVAQEHGITRDDLKAALLQTVRSHLDQARQQGRLTQEQEARLLASLEQRIDRLIDAQHGQPPSRLNKRGPRA